MAARFAVIVGQPFGDTISILTKDAFSLNPIELSCAFVIASLNSIEHFAVIHDVWFTINDWTPIQPRSEKVARVDITGGSDLGSRLGGRVLVRW